MCDAVSCRRSGFTLIEIMIVIAIIAILAGIAIPNFREARAEAQLAGCRQNIQVLINALNMAEMRMSRTQLVGAIRIGEGYSATNANGRAFTTIMDTDGSNIQGYLVDNGYLGNILKCPASGAVYLSIISPAFDAVLCTNIASRVGGHIIGNQRICPRYNVGSSSTVLAGWDDTVTDL